MEGKSSEEKMEMVMEKVNEWWLSSDSNNRVTEEKNLPHPTLSGPSSHKKETEKHYLNGNLPNLWLFRVSI